MAAAGSAVRERDLSVYRGENTGLVGRGYPPQSAEVWVGNYRGRGKRERKRFFDAPPGLVGRRLRGWGAGWGARGRLLRPFWP